MTSDVPQPITQVDTPFIECNIHCLSNPLYYGDMSNQEAPLLVGAYAWFRDGNLKDIYVKNYTGGSNGKVVAVFTPRKVI
jgi:hypothetical protein